MHFSGGKVPTKRGSNGIEPIPIWDFSLPIRFYLNGLRDSAKMISFTTTSLGSEQSPQAVPRSYNYFEIHGQPHAASDVRTHKQAPGRGNRRGCPGLPYKRQSCGNRSFMTRHFRGQMLETSH
ncbi:hypothetical protein RRG08_050281 [Elysia crispata]|uniref:Uncharacterized protein n=1 Tax=Elysia crispata TaxID=231223 RepID=A0AAE1E9I2_9GAST|nr:hypothetical protein RRG08_050281 [Elysia crispata]